MRSIMAGLGLAVLAFGGGCGTMPARKLEAIQSAPPEKTFGSPQELLAKHPPQAELREKPVELSIGEGDPILRMPEGKTTAKAFRVVTRGKDAPYLVMFSFLHSVAYARSGLVIPDPVFFGPDGKIVKARLVQVGHDRMCGWIQCMKFAFEVGDLPPGSYDVVVVARVGEADRPFRFNRTDTVSYSPGVGALPLSFDVPVYADYFGELRASLDRKLPFDPARKGVYTAPK
jgi:hypothetical protein